MYPLAFVFHFWYKFYARLVAAQGFCIVPCNSADFDTDSPRPVNGQLRQTPA
jgi:hypothetical protein